MEVDVNWNAAQRSYTSRENDYANNEASVAVQIGADGSVSVLTEAEIAVEREALCT